jgi:Tfp pilus assembly protein PilN
MPGLHSSTDVKKFIAIGSGVGIEVGTKDLEISAVRVRPNGVSVLGTTTIRDFRERPAAEWGNEYAQFLHQAGVSHVAATVLLPRREIIVRQIALSGVAPRDLAAAVALQVDTLHPYGEEEVVYGWSQVAAGGILIGILRRTALDQYVSLFAEAGAAVACFTFSAAAIYGAHRVPVAQTLFPATGFVALAAGTDGAWEVYGESTAKPVFSAEFELTAERATALAISELRLEPDLAPVPLDRVLPAPRVNPVTNDLGKRSLPYATALVGACPWLTPVANLLPQEQRRSNSRAMYIPTIVLSVVLVLLCAALAVHSWWEERQYMARLEAEIARVEPRAKRSAALDRDMVRAQSRIHVLDEFRSRTKGDLEALNGLTTLLPPPVWTNTVDLTPDAATISGEADQAAPLLKVLDASLYFRNSTFVGALAKAGGNEQFQIRTTRRPQP